MNAVGNMIADIYDTNFTMIEREDAPVLH